MSELYERIEKLCKDNGTNVTQMCKELKISRSSLTELKNGRSKSLSMSALASIAGFFGVPVDSLTAAEALPENVQFALKRQITDAAADLTEEELNDVLSYIKFKQSQRS